MNEPFRRVRLGAPEAVVAVLTLAFAWACIRFVAQPVLAGFADDSVSYLIMGQVFSPWRPASPAVAAAFASEAFYPPLFGLLLGLSGAAHDLARAHVLVALLVAASLPVAYLLGLRLLEDRRAAAAATLCIAALPAPWINAMGILSEPLFGVLLLASFLALPAEGPVSRSRLVLLAALLAALVLTRTAALPLAGVYALWALSRRDRAWAERFRLAVPALVAFAAYAAWVLLRPAETTDSYARILGEHAWGGALAGLLRQVHAVAEGWVGSLLIYWIEGRPARALLAGLAGVAALAGLVLRLREGLADGWLTAAYLAVFLAWPFYDQMGRFLFPVLPVLVLYAFLAASRAVALLQRPALLGTGVMALFFLSLTLPALAFLHQRAQWRGPEAGIVDWYRTPGLDAARARAQVHLDLFADLAEVRKLTAPGDRVMWVTPAYVALLADRVGVKAPDDRLAPENYRKAVAASGATHVLLTLYNPRDTLRADAWEAGTRALLKGAQPLHLRVREGGTVVSAVLLRVER